MKYWIALPLFSCLLLSVGPQPEIQPGVRLLGEFLIPPATSFPSITPPRFGGISGLATLPGGCELLAISDDDRESRFYRLRVSTAEEGLRVTPVERTFLGRASGAPARLDPEGIALTKRGTVLISSEGIGAPPRLPPAILEYAQDGRFIQQLPVPKHFVPNATGPLKRGVRRNGGFESLTVTPDFTRLFTANELPLVQDGPADAFAEGGRVRIVEYVTEGESYRPAREFVYELSPPERPPFETGESLNGVSELLAVSGTELLALERGFIRMRGTGIGVNAIRLFRISLEGATDVSSFESLAGRDGITPVRKTLVQDFSGLAGRSLRLINLENFEGLAWVGKDPDRGLLVVSDDNFNPLQVTAFLLLEPAGAAAARAPCP
ncbi:MAG TPA: esterase-like activity of phytase family protein [Vicinamibacterales bacterium]